MSGSISFDITVASPPTAPAYGYSTSYVITDVANDSSYVELTATTGSGVQALDVNPSVKVGAWVYVTGTGIVSLDKKSHQIRTITDGQVIVLETAYVSADSGLTATMSLNPNHMEIDI